MPPSGHTLRDYKPQDFPALWELDQQCFVEGIAYSEEELKYFLSHKNGFTIVAERQGAIQGFILVQKELKMRAGHVITIDVHEDARRSGLGTLLMNAAEERLASANYDSVLLEVAVDNAPAIGFYKRHGYSVLKTLPRYYLNSIDGLLMGKKISE
ncbi:MAG: GCN5-related N-acetyltransferase [Acidobacteriales bacterium]|nr:GCN5-related N-acetyltransferase [Terriglobales bacterium]